MIALSQASRHVDAAASSAISPVSPGPVATSVDAPAAPPATASGAARRLSLAEQMAAVESERGDAPTDTSDLAHVLAHALGVAEGGIVNALLERAELVLFSYELAGDIILANDVTDVVQRLTYSANLLHRAERAASRADIARLRAESSSNVAEVIRSGKVAILAGELLAFAAPTLADEEEIRGIRVRVRALGKVDEHTRPLHDAAERLLVRIGSTFSEAARAASRARSMASHEVFFDGEASAAAELVKNAVRPCAPPAPSATKRTSVKPRSTKPGKSARRGAKVAS